MQAPARSFASGRRAWTPSSHPSRPGPLRSGRRHHPSSRAGVIVRADPTASGDVELWELHDELLREIQERKQQQARLLEQLNNIGPKNGSSSRVLVHQPTNGASSAVKPMNGAGTATKPAAPATHSSNGAGSSSSLRPPPVMKPPPAPAQEQLNKMLARQAAPPPAPSKAPPVPPVTSPSFANEVLARPYVEPEVVTGPAPVLPKLSPKPEPLVAPEPPEEEDKPPPLAGPNVMNVVMVGAECAPWSKTGGLGDVMGALPKALARRGHRVMVVAPRYEIYDDAWETGIRRIFRVFNGDVEVGYFHCFLDGVDYVFVDHPSYHFRKADIYGGDRSELQFRCALLCKAALEAVWHVPCGGIPYGDNNTVYIANDWHTALLPVYLQAHYRDYGQMTYARSVFVIHNMAHQGRGPFVETDNLELSEHYKEQFRLFDPIGGEHMNIMKAGLQNAHSIIAVSEGYAWECTTQEGGWGLDRVINDNRWKLRGIVNGIDTKEWNPEVDKYLTSDGYCQYSLKNLVEGKRQCKLALQKELGLPQNADIPLLGFIGRLDYQKGVDLIRDSHGWLMSQGVQLVMLGSGREDLENDLRGMEAGNKQQTRGWVGFSVKMAHRITAGCDILLMPSRFEPCGLNQLYAMAYGTPPVVHAVGGLRDTVKPYNPYENTGTGWTFERAEGELMRTAIGHALTTYKEHSKSFQDIMRRGMEQDLSWDHAADLYEQALIKAKYQW